MSNLKIPIKDNFNADTKELIEIVRKQSAAKKEYLEEFRINDADAKAGSIIIFAVFNGMDYSNITPHIENNSSLFDRYEYYLREIRNFQNSLKYLGINFSKLQYYKQHRRFNNITEIKNGGKQ